MVQLFVVIISVVCLAIGLSRRFSPPRHLLEADRAPYLRQAEKLIIVSVIAGVIGVGISFVG